MSAGNLAKGEGGGGWAEYPIVVHKAVPLILLSIPSLSPLKKGASFSTSPELFRWERIILRDLGPRRFPKHEVSQQNVFFSPSDV